MNETPAYGWSLLVDEMLSAMDTGVRYGAMTLTSAYRNPAHNEAIGGVHNSQHTHEDAADIRNPTGDTAGRNEILAAAPPSPDKPDYIEPTTQKCGLACVHGDWRNHSQVYAHTYIASFRPPARNRGLVAGVLFGGHLVDNER